MRNNVKRIVVLGLLCFLISFMFSAPKAEAGCWNRCCYSSCYTSYYSSCYYPAYSYCYYPSYSYCYYPTTYSSCYYPAYDYCYYPTYYSYYPTNYSYYPSWSDSYTPIQAPFVPKSSPSDSDATATSYIKPISTARHVAYFDVTVPSDAKIYVNDHLTKKTGVYRTFKSYLTDEAEYSFTVRAEIVVDGKKIEQTKTLKLGDRQKGSLSFDLNANAESADDLALDRN